MLTFFTLASYGQNGQSFEEASKDSMAMLHKHDSLISIGVDKLKNNDLSTALYYFNIVINKGGCYGGVYYYRGRCKEKLNDLRGAIQDYTFQLKHERSLYLFMRDSTFISNILLARGRSYGQLKQYNNALKDLNEAAKFSPDSPNIKIILYLRGLVKHYLKMENGACDDLSKAGELGMMEAYDLIKEWCN